MAEPVTVVIPVWNRKDLLEKLLATLQAQTWPIEEVVAVDNGSTDGAAELAERADARVIRLGSNHGFSFAVNRGIEVCRTGLIAVVNTDVELEPDWLAHLATALESPEVWFATGKLLRSGAPSIIDGTFDVVSRAGCAWRVGHDCPDRPVFDQRRMIWIAPATAALYRRELFRSVGPFDPGFESYLEDVDFGLRCAARGLRGVYEPRAVGRHRGSATLGVWHRETVRRIARNQVLLVAKHYPGSQVLEQAWPILVGQGLWGLVALRHGGFWAYLAGKAEGLTRFREFRRSGEGVESGRLRQILHDGEQEILAIQRVTGLSAYWRWYFRLTGGLGRIDT